MSAEKDIIDVYQCPHVSGYVKEVDGEMSLVCFGCGHRIRPHNKKEPTTSVCPTANSEMLEELAKLIVKYNLYDDPDAREVCDIIARRVKPQLQQKMEEEECSNGGS